jgi:BCD family chlorophyll transporter-like MFS transporter
MPMVSKASKRKTFASLWSDLSPEWLPFADAVTPELPLLRLLRLSLFQATVGLAVVLLNGTLNRVMIVELNVPAWIVALMISLPLVFAPLRVLIGHRSDHHRSFLGWRRVPYIWMGTMLQFGGLAIMPFALFILSGDTTGPVWIGTAGAALAFLLVGAGLHTTQTSGLALAMDLAPEHTRPRVVALMYVTLLLGMGLSAIVFGLLLRDFSQFRLIQVVQGSALVTFAVNVFALWKQEPQNLALTAPDRPRPDFRSAWRQYVRHDRTRRLLISVAFGTAAFGMQDVLLEPYGGEVLGLSVSATTVLTALLAGGTLCAFLLASRLLTTGRDPARLAAWGCVWGLLAFVLILVAPLFESAALFRTGAFLVGFGAGWFAVGTLTAAMDMAEQEASGLALGAWGAVQATAAGVAIAAGGALRDLVTRWVDSGLFGSGLSGPLPGYSVVYQLEIVLLFFTLAAIGPLARSRRMVGGDAAVKGRLGLSELPG